ncbi:Regulator of chromosome condensation (RCC1) family with FYVEzinc finger domain [Zostera marina]|uniref:Regulator of chromosome condensation (RCC1) family with FYVEzinc finger domain n=1 Tax=Zostera marina TaxID=29655 RepID=A0A0K9P4Z4_ZOSMR|nr:Regulator of chromosome condensation (RCC1) family with FYVEzinc finger domain [Zostera marina]
MLQFSKEEEAQGNDKALLALKKGTPLIKYCRKGKPKQCPFRLSTDETSLIWYSHKAERNIKLESVSQIIPGQRTAVFRRFFCPEKDYLSFSLIYKNGDRSLDLICKNKDEFEIWFGTLSALVFKGQKKTQNPKIEGSLDSLSFDSLSSQGLPFSVTSGIPSSSSSQTSDATFNIARKSDVGPDRASIMQSIRQSNTDTCRNSVSSTPSYFTQGSGPDDCESLGDVYIWGELWCDSTTDIRSNTIISRTDVLLPKPLECNVVLDVHQISCGVKHASLVTRQGEVFTWGEESGGRLGLGTDINASSPKLVDLLSVNYVESVACGEYHTCAVSVHGDLFTWGDGTNNIGLLGHGSDVSHWMPKRVCGPLEGIQVHLIACGTWHSALVTTNGKLFTFGDGSFGVLGHGDRESSLYPREVEYLSKSKTLKVACGAWHTAAIIEVSGQFATTANSSTSKKLFTWGDGDKYRLGHGDNNPRLVPTCVSLLIEYNFHQLACGHTMTIGLTTSGRVFTMGSTAYGQLGNHHSDGKLPCVVHERLANELVEDIACGSYHVVVLTSRSELYTWGNGGNGRLGQGDLEDRKTPTLIEALKDRHVKSISCGSNFTACVCIHKWMLGADQSVCSGCRQAFGFTKKRHNCYNCGLVSCHACSSKKVLRAALAPTPGKPHRVCDSCYSKIKAAESVTASTVIKKQVVPSPWKLFNVKKSKLLFSSSTQPVKSIMVKPARHWKMKSETLLHLKEISFPNVKPQLIDNDNALNLEPIVTTQTPVTSSTNSRSVSPYKLSPSPCIAPISSRAMIENLKKKNELLNQQVLNLQEQVRSSWV